MKKSLVAAGAALLVGVVLAYAAAGPFITLYQIKAALQAKDAPRLAHYIDFPELRTNLKEQINTLILNKLPAGVEDNPFGAMGLALAATLVDGLVDGYVTPSGLATLLSGKLPDLLGAQPQADTSAAQPPTTAPAGTQYSFESARQFSVRVQVGNQRAIRLVLERTGLTWKLTNIILPFAP